MKQINKVAVLGAGVMGLTIAAHLANAGVQVLLLDLVQKEPNDAEKKAGLTSNDPTVRNRIAMSGIEGLRKIKPAAFFLPAYASYIEAGNFDDDIKRLRECDWVIEVVVETMEIKKHVFSGKVAPNLKEGAIVSSNTSGLSVNEMAASLPDQVRKNFLGTHFFNPPRYMRLLEIIPSKFTDPDVVRFMAGFIEKRLGKGIVFAKDTPNFIANRIGVFSIFNGMHHMIEMGMTVEEADAVAGPATARPKSALFRTADLVGLDTMQHVAANAYENLANDEQREVFRLPGFVNDMVKKGLLGNKSERGFFKKETGENGPAFFYYDYKTGEYAPSLRPGFASVDAVKAIDDPGKRLQAVLSGAGKEASFAWRNLRDTLIYAFNRIPEIADDIVNIDNAMKWGFNWELGPFEMFDAVGVKNFVERAEKDKVDVPVGLKSIGQFYKFESNNNLYYDILAGGYKEVPRPAGNISLALLTRSNKVMEKNSGSSLIDLGDGVFCLEFHSKMNSIGNDILSMILQGVRLAEQDGVGLVIANEGRVFSAGANLVLIAMAIAEGAYDELALTIKNFQKAMMAIKYSKIPVVAAPHNMALAGGCEVCLHADAMNPHAETYMGLVEVGVGLIPAGGGTKEMAIRAIKLAGEYDTDVGPFIYKNFSNIALARVSTSAAELFDIGYMRHGDAFSMDPDKRIFDAKQKAIALSANYRPSRPLIDLKAPGRSVAATIKSQVWNMKMGGRVTEFDELLAGTIADVITGGDVPAGTLITEEYFLELEREAFLKMCGQKKTLERIQYMLKKGKPLRN
jgi:3-hydroxyacyl-CoA dehydrogenase